MRLTEAEVTESVYKSDHTVLGDSSGGSPQAVVIMKSQMSYWQVMNEDEDGDIREDCNKSKKFVDNFASHRYVFCSDSRPQYGSENINGNVECYKSLFFIFDLQDQYFY